MRDGVFAIALVFPARGLTLKEFPGTKRSAQHMQKYIFSLMLVFVAAASCINESTILADEAQGEGPEASKDPIELDEDVLKAADDLRLTYTNEQQTLVNGLRYLLRPAFEEELMLGRRYRPCVLEPFENSSEAPLTQLEQLRLLAVLQSGLAPTGATDRQITRLFLVPILNNNLNLAPLAIDMLLCRAIYQRPHLNADDEAKSRAERLLASLGNAKDATSARSPLIQGKVTQCQWYANHMWLGLIMRSALDLGLEIDDRVWDNALKDLCEAEVKERGYITRKGAADVGGDLNPNLMALAALSFASTAPEGVIGRAALKDVQKAIKNVPELVSRLRSDYAQENWGGARLMLVESLASEFSPERESGDAWREAIRRTSVAQYETSGASMRRSVNPADMGLGSVEQKRSDSIVCETALNCLSLSGGLYQTTDAPLADVELASVGRLMYALGMLHAGSSRAGGADFESRVKFAIEDGCHYLARVQKDDGNFPGMYEGTAGNTAICLLAMMHGGMSRTDQGIQNGLAWLRANCGQGRAGNTYSIALVLMFFQYYYEREQRETGIISADNPKDHLAAKAEMWSKLAKEDAKLVEDMVSTLDDSNVGGTRGGYTYGPTGGGGRSDNSCSQFAMLGYKAASLLGAEIKVSTFEKEARRLIKQYSPDESCEEVEYEHSDDDREGDDNERRSSSSRGPWKSKIKPGGWGYTCGDAQDWRSMDLTAAGISTLVICMDELKVRGRLSKEMAREIGLTIRGAEVWTAKHYYRAEDLAHEKSDLRTSRSDGHGTFYGLYSVERGCVLAGIRKLNEEVDWYRIGADALIDSQNMEGNWGIESPQPAPGRRSRAQLINTSMAILFLKMAAPPVITEHKKRERERAEREEKQNPKNPITSGPEDKKKDAEKKPENPQGSED